MRLAGPHVLDFELGQNRKSADSSKILTTPFCTGPVVRRSDHGPEATGSQTSITGPSRGGWADCCFLRSETTRATHAVQVGSMSTKGMNSTRNVGKSNG